MEKYLYGAAVQGIQAFIYQTNVLKDVAGASELVNEICDTMFLELQTGGEIILNAAGNIKCIFKDETELEKVVKYFPQMVLQRAPGITISQAAVRYSDKDFYEALIELEKRLKTQRNKPMRSQTLGLMGINRSRSTGLPAVTTNNFSDQGSVYKQRNNDQRGKHILYKKCIGKEFSDNKGSYSIDNLTGSNDWIAVVHIDGNGLGQIVPKVSTSPEKLKKFSEELNNATIAAARAATQSIIKNLSSDEIIPIRPIVLGGDDLTLICRGDIAMDYVNTFLQEFESQTRSKIGGILRESKAFGNGKGDCLTACAGIAFIKSSYPFYYGYNLAESLCSRAKKEAKKEKNLINGLAPSCFMFHKIQDSFITNYDDIIKRELLPLLDISFKFGPYFTNEGTKPSGFWSFAELIDMVESINDKDGNILKTHCRQWMSILHEKGKEAAAQKEQRMNEIISKSKSRAFKKLMQARIDEEHSAFPKSAFPIYDVLSLCSILYQKTK